MYWMLLLELELDEQHPLIPARKIMEAIQTGTELEPRPLYVRVPCEASARALVLICNIKHVLPNRAREIYNETEQRIRLATPSSDIFVDESVVMMEITKTASQ
jgi:hypothetical protein